jgi:pilus assembly protein CpaC
LSIYAPLASAAGSITVAINHSLVMNMANVWRVAVANPEIADVVVVSESEILVVGKTSGITTLHTWSVNGHESFEIEVGDNNSMIANNIKNILGYNDVKVSKVNKTVILEGKVNDQYQKSRAEKVAEAYGEKVINLLELTNPKQVKIEAKILEISRDKLDNLGIKWGNNPATAPGVFSAGQSAIQSIPSQRDLFGWFGSYDDLNAQIDALIQDGHAKILSQPNMVTVSGEKANILVGGEIPVPVSVNNNQISVVWKEYGIKLVISPEVNAEGLIASNVKAEVSSIDYTNPKAMVDLGNGLIIPALKTRKAETVITMPSGKTMAIGGLISSDDSKYVTKFPFLSEIPILGKFFTSSSTSKNTREILILMTPTLVDISEYSPSMTLGMKGFLTENPLKLDRNSKDGHDNGNIKK